MSALGSVGADLMEEAVDSFNVDRMPTLQIDRAISSISPEA